MVASNLVIRASYTARAHRASTLRVGEMARKSVTAAPEIEALIAKSDTLPDNDKVLAEAVARTERQDKERLEKRRVESVRLV